MANLSSGSTGHEAGASALGFYYQAHYALLSLLRHASVDSAISVERLDDVQLEVNGQHLLAQLKHSLSKRPPAISLSSKALWKTIKVWIDALPSVSLASTKFHLIAVGSIPSDSQLLLLCEENTDRRPLLLAMAEEAKRVVDTRATSSKKNLPYAERAPGCEAFLALSDSDRLNLLRQIEIFPNSPDIIHIEGLIAQRLTYTPIEYRPSVTKRLVEWWGLQIIHSLCGVRDRAISFTELQYMLMEIESDLIENNLSWEFEDAMFPPGHLPHRMLERQIALVNGSKVDLKRSTRDQWRAHEQRSNWVSNNPSMKLKVARYDTRLVECWSDLYEQMVLDCEDQDETTKQESGLKLLKWTYDEAPKNIEPISTPSRHFYIRGAYQTLSIDRRVGWHPDYIELLEDES